MIPDLRDKNILFISNCVYWDVYGGAYNWAKGVISILTLYFNCNITVIISRKQIGGNINDLDYWKKLTNVKIIDLFEEENYHLMNYIPNKNGDHIKTHILFNTFLNIYNSNFDYIISRGTISHYYWLNISERDIFNIFSEKNCNKLFDMQNKFIYVLLYSIYDPPLDWIFNTQSYIAHISPYKYLTLDNTYDSILFSPAIPNMQCDEKNELDNFDNLHPLSICCIGSLGPQSFLLNILEEFVKFKKSLSNRYNLIIAGRYNSKDNKYLKKLYAFINSQESEIRTSIFIDLSFQGISNNIAKEYYKNSVIGIRLDENQSNVLSTKVM